MVMIDTKQRTVKRIETPQHFSYAKKRVAAYCRVSVDYEINLNSLNAQVDYYTRIINSNPLWEFAGVYADEGITGTTSKRSGFERLLSDCDSGKIDTILTKSISRFARNTVLLLQTIRHLKEKNINVRFERENIDSLSENGELLLTLLASFAQEESKSISDNTKWAIRKNFEKGIGNNFNRIYGYSYDGEKFSIVESEASVVRFIFSSYLSAMSPDEIVKELKAKGIVGLHNRPFTYSTIWGMLRQEKYTGCSLLQKTYNENYLTHKSVRNKGELTMYMAEGTRPVIIDKCTFDAVQKEIKRRSSLGILASKSVQFNPFSAKIVCAKCGKHFRRANTGICGRHKTVYYKWVCGTKIVKGASGCSAVNIPEKKLFEIAYSVTDNLQNIIRISVSDSALTFYLIDKRVIEKEFVHGKS